jgi:3-hydroxybutyryl-CoA dehydrogenase
MMAMIENVAVIGAGLMGHGIAQIFADQGYAVTLMDLEPSLLSGALKKIRSNLSLMAERGIGRPEDMDNALSRIRTTLEMKEAAEGSQFVIEAVSENLELKQKVFRELDSLCPPDTILATNTSVISITEIATKSGHRGRIVGTHFWNPPYLIPLVEVIRGEDTSDETMNRTFKLLESVGKHPVRVNKDVPGFVGNRLQHALWREAISIVEQGIADAATVDECIRFGFGLRLPILGPLENADMVGTDLTLAIHNYILRHLESSPEPSPLLRKKVEQGDLGFKSGHGFQDWPPEEVEKSRKRLQEYLLKVMKKQEVGK